ncbi:MAG TPA: alpha/beta fold hydrolase [Candidatus Dormibacteraeota bacterium]|nr:alpha/beta fold hydrolase [Candidatus Dormibacteraeota bacterium]
MKSRTAIRAIAAVSLCVAGAWLALPNPYRQTTAVFDAAGCRLETSILQKPNTEPLAAVVLFHGLSANKKLMAYIGRGFAEWNLRVYAPDLPGHGRTDGPFSPARAEQCSEALLRELLVRGLILPNRTILAGHSMGGTLAVHLASHTPLAGVIMISPAPMRPSHGVPPEALLYTMPPALPPNTLILSGRLEPEAIRSNAQELLSWQGAGPAKHVVIPWATHVTLLFNRAAVRVCQEWVARTLNLHGDVAPPSRRMLLGFFMGFCGLLLMASPFLCEVTGKSKITRPTNVTLAVGLGWFLCEIAIASIASVVVLQLWIPLRVLHLFEGDYLASFVLFVGVALLLVHWKALVPALNAKLAPLLQAACAALVLLLLFTAWFDLTFSEVWITAARWARFPLLFVALLPFHILEETWLGSTGARASWRRLTIALSFRLLMWMALVGGIVFLHSGEILLLLLVPYMALFSVLQRRGMDVVRKATGSAAASAIFGAILLAGLCLVIFPIA